MSPRALADAVQALMPLARRELAELVAFRSVADASLFPASECEAAARWIARALSALDFTGVRLLDTPDGSKAVWGELPAPAGSPTVLLYAHYDVQPPIDEAAWATDPFRLTEVGERWYGRGAADCKGNVLMHLTALRALAEVHGGMPPVHVKFVAEGSEEQGTGGLERYAEAHPELLAADAVVIADTGNTAVGTPTLTTSLRGMVTVEVRTRTLAANVHSGSFGGAAPDALVALIRVLDSLYDEDGGTVVDGLEAGRTWAGAPYPADRFREDAEVLPAVPLTGGGEPADLVWARPAATVLGIDCPGVAGATSAVQGQARALVSLRVPPGTPAADAREALARHLEAADACGAEVTVDRLGAWEPFEAATGGPAHRAMRTAMRDVFGTEPAYTGQGGSIPVCVTLAALHPDAEFLLLGVQDPSSRIHSVDESVDPTLLARMATAEALFLRRLADRSAG
ncbi:dipeptidase [Streptomyces lavendofoliae]|uniref:dipeptidase n=1 Tax=Streptomyces lavendofoliae TaxID=67314 RepID=UPI003D8F3402